MQIPKNYKVKRLVKTTSEYLINFEKQIKELYEKGKIRAPIHLSTGNEKQLLKIFSYISKDDLVLTGWRNHLHALIHGVPEKKVINFITGGKSMSMSSKYPFFMASSIVGGVLPIALGLAKSLKIKKNKKKVWCFIGDMTFETGIFHECYKYSRNFDLPLEFVIEDNKKSTNTPTSKAWGKSLKVPKDVFYYKYNLGYPHHGTGKWVLF